MIQIRWLGTLWSRLSRVLALRTLRTVDTLLPVVALLAGAGISVTIFRTSISNERNAAKLHFGLLAEENVSSVETRIAQNSAIVGGVASFFNASQSVDRREFAVFVRTFLDRNKSIHAVQWVPRVLHRDRARFEEAARRDGLPGFHFREWRSPHETQTAGIRPDYFVVYYNEPPAPNAAVTGLDNGSERVRRSTLLASAQRGAESYSAPITLIQGEDGHNGYLVFHPVYELRTVSGTVSPKKGLRGFAVGSFVMDEVLRASLGPANSRILRMEVWDITDRDGPQLLGSAGEQGNPSDGLSYDRIESVANRTWRFHVTPGPAYAAPTSLAETWRLAFGLVLTLSVFMSLLYRARATGRLHDSEALYRSILTASPDDITVFDLSGRIKAVSPVAYRMFGVEPGTSVLGWSITDFLAPEDRERAMSNLAGRLTNDTPPGVREYRAMRANGEVFPIEASAEFTYGADGKPSGMVLIARDITERKRTETALEQSNERLVQAQALAHVGNWELDIVQRMMWASSEAWRIYGIATAQPVLPYDQAARIALAEDRPRLNAAMSALLQGIGEYDLEFRIIRPIDGETRIIHSEAYLVRDADGAASKIVGVIQDVTERKQMQEAIERRVVALTRPLAQDQAIGFDELFDLEDIQRIQDEFAAATGVASIITRPDGAPITTPSRFTRLCGEIVRKTEKGCANCYKSDACLGAPRPDGPIVQPCLSGGLWDAGVSIVVGDHHIANWLIGQVRDETQTEEAMREYAREIGADEGEFIEAFREVPSMSADRFNRIAQALFTLVNQLSTSAHQNVQQARFISDRKRAEEALRESEERFRSLFEHSSDMVAVVDADGQIMFQCSSIKSILGYDATAMVGRSVFDLLHPDDHPTAKRALREAVSTPGASPPMEVRVRHSDGYWRQVEIIGSNQLDRPEIRGIIINSRDITERKVFEEELRHQAFHDSLTGLPNRILFRDRVEHALVRAARRDRNVAVLFIDLDHFKVVNDSLGHQAGDQLLVEVAGRIRSCLRAEDTAARLGGDEFTVLLEDMTDEAEATLLAERILRRLGMPFEVGTRETFINASIGIVVSAGTQDTADEMLREADVAMYEAKNAGRGRYMLFLREMSLHAHERMEMETDLRRAIERGEFRVHYQPIISLETSKVVGVEALARWEHPRYGLMPPDSFIPIQEQIGLMGPFTLWVLKEAQIQCLAWHRAGYRLPVSVNLSPVNLHEEDFVQSVANVLLETGLDPAWLKLEITENAVMINPAQAKECLGKFDRMGIRLSMDDFGTGHSSLSYLKQLPVHEVKIDKSFALAISGRDDDNAAIVRATIDMAHNLRKKVVAEGVETKAVWSLLDLLGCDAAQGYFMARPMPPEEFLEWLETSPWSVSGAVGRPVSGAARSDD